MSAPAGSVQREGEAPPSPHGPAEKPLEQPQEFSDPAYPPIVKKSAGYAVEGNKIYATPFDLSLYEQDLHNAYYKPYFSGRLHRNLLATHADGDSAVISIEKPEGAICRVLCRTKNGNERLIIPLLQTTKELSKTLKTLRPELNKFHFSSVIDEELERELEHLENQQLVHHYKMGLLYAKPGQTENEIYGNLEHSAAFEEFASLMGDRIDLQGFLKFRGGLDVQKNSTGKHSYFTNFRGYDIMYHLNTFLPYFPADPQHLERKRHVGNDVSVIIFVDGTPAPDGSVQFDPSILTSEMNHVFVIVCPLPMKPGDAKRKYQVSFAMKDTIRPTQPFLPWPPVFERGSEFREFLLTKIINTERVALTSGVFKEKLTKTRRMELQMMAAKYLSQKEDKKKKK